MRKHSLLAGGALALAGLIPSVPATAALVISEYIEGSSNNKAIEITNRGVEPVDLASYQLQTFFNGNTSAGLTLSLAGTLAPGATYVVAHASALPEMVARANQTTAAGWFNGDDAVALVNNGEWVDVFGQIGFDPGAAWGSGDLSTANRTLRRLASVTEGDATGDDPFDPALEWQGFPQDDYSDLGNADSGDGGTDPEPVTGCGELATLISAIQGEGDESPLAGQTVSVEAVVVGDFQGSSRLRGFFLQEEAQDQDGNPLTSEGLFVFDNSGAIDVSEGDRVRVTGTVTEYFGLTELTSLTAVDICAQGQTFSSTALTLPLDDAAALEALEGMRIHLPQTLTVSENYNLARYGQLVLSSGRLMNPTNIALPGADAQAVMAQNALNRILLDDGSSAQNPTLVPYPAPALSAANSVRSGDQVQSVEGVLYYGFSEWSVQPVVTPQFIASNPRTATPALVAGGNLTVASFNVLNFFNGDGVGGGFPTERGASSAEELERQAAKIVSAIRALDADVLGLMELENDGFTPTSAIAELVARINATPGDTYAYVDAGLSQVGGDAITVGILYKPAVVQPQGAAATIATAPFDFYNRQPLAQTFVHSASGETLTVVVNHFKSKGCSGATDSNVDQGDGQGCWNAKRVEAANALASWLASDPTGAGSRHQLIIGDLNAYAKEDPITALEAGGYTNLIAQFVGADAYSYVFNGEAGYLDHALASADLLPSVVAVQEWHINADEPRALDYNVEFKSAQQQVDFYAADAYRSSDHDPVQVVLNLQTPAPKGDFNADGVRNLKDLLLLLRQLFRPLTDANVQFDLNGDGRINLTDLLAFFRL
ncbi:MAG: ExeM/NucH family extracellular endonuclease [Gammaproteobacteria bacterium]